MLQDDCQSPGPRPEHSWSTEAVTQASCQKFTMCSRTRLGGRHIVQFSTLQPGYWLCLCALVFLAGSVRGWAEEGGSKSSGGSSQAKSSHTRRPYPPLRSASGQASGSPSTPPARASVPPLRDAVAATTPPLVVDGKSYLLVGRGELTGSETPRYQAALYLEHAGARMQFGSLTTRAPTRAQLMSENRAQYFVIWGRFARMLVLKMTRPASKAELAAMFHSGMPEVFGDRTPAELRKDAESLVKLIDRDLAEGQELRIHISESGQIDLYLDGNRRVGPQNTKLSRHVLEIWFGYHSVARSLRNVLIDKIEVLKTPLAKPIK